MNEQDAELTFGKIIFQDNNFEVRAKIKGKELKVYAFRRFANITLIPRGFISGSNALFFHANEKVPP